MNKNLSTSDIHTKNINATIAKIQKNLATTYQDLLDAQNSNSETLLLYQNYFDKINTNKQQKISMLNYLIKHLEQIKNSSTATQQELNNINNDIKNLKNQVDRLQ